MGYPVKCNWCRETHTAPEIVELIRRHRDKNGNLMCRTCGRDAYICRESGTQGGDAWNRYIRAAIPFRTRYGRGFVPYVFLVSDSPRGRPTDVHFGYYKDLRPKGGALKHGHGPGGVPVFGKPQFLKLLEQAIAHDVVSPSDVFRVVRAVAGNRAG